MKSEFLLAVELGNLTKIRSLMQDNVSSFSIRYYVNKDDIIKTQLEGDLTRQQLDEKIRHLQDNFLNSAKELAYITSASLDETQLNKATVNSALLLAAKNGDQRILDILLSGGFANAYPVVLKGDLTEVHANEYFKHFIEPSAHQFNCVKADPNIKNESGESALQLAVQSNSKTCATLLMEFGSTIPSLETDRVTYLFCKEALSDLLDNCGVDTKLKLKQKFKETFPELFPPPKWYILLSYIQKLGAHFMSHRFIAPIFNRLAQAVYVSRSTVVNHGGIQGITNSPPPPPLLTHEAAMAESTERKTSASLAQTPPTHDTKKTPTAKKA